MDKYQNKLLNAINDLILHHIKDLPYDKTLTAKVTQVNATDYTVLYKNEELICKARAGLTLLVGDVVFIKVPLGQMDNKYIIDKKP